MSDPTEAFAVSVLPKLTSEPGSREALEMNTAKSGTPVNSLETLSSPVSWLRWSLFVVSQMGLMALIEIPTSAPVLFRLHARVGMSPPSNHFRRSIPMSNSEKRSISVVLHDADSQRSTTLPLRVIGNESAVSVFAEGYGDSEAARASDAPCFLNSTAALYVSSFSPTSIDKIRHMSSTSAERGRIFGLPHRLIRRQHRPLSKVASTTRCFPTLTLRQDGVTR